jgi:hypothetical protein
MVVHIFYTFFDSISLPFFLDKVAQIYLGQDLMKVNLGFHRGVKTFWQNSLALKSLVLFDLLIRLAEHTERRSRPKPIKISRLGSFTQLRFKLKTTTPPPFHAC